MIRLWARAAVAALVGIVSAFAVSEGSSANTALGVGVIEPCVMSPTKGSLVADLATKKDNARTIVNSSHFSVRQIVIQSMFMNDFAIGTESKTSGGFAQIDLGVRIGGGVYMSRYGRNLVRWRLTRIPHGQYKYKAVFMRAFSSTPDDVNVSSQLPSERSPSHNYLPKSSDGKNSSEQSKNNRERGYYEIGTAYLT